MRAQDSDEFGDSLNLFHDESNGQIYTKISSGSKCRRYLTNYLSSFEEQKSELITQIENYSPIYISKNEGPMFFIENEFTENIGIKGGAISIDTPNSEPV